MGLGGCRPGAVLRPGRSPLAGRTEDGFHVKDGSGGECVGSDDRVVTDALDAKEASVDGEADLP
jgi:hypothetical protein